VVAGHRMPVKPQYDHPGACQSQMFTQRPRETEQIVPFDLLRSLHAWKTIRLVLPPLCFRLTDAVTDLMNVHHLRVGGVKFMAY
jgi:hypothetical protein